MNFVIQFNEIQCENTLNNCWYPCHKKLKTFLQSKFQYRGSLFIACDTNDQCPTSEKELYT